MNDSGISRLSPVFASVELLTSGDPTGPLALEDRAIHVRGFLLDGSAAAVARCRSWLSEEERARADRFVRPDDRTRYILAHGGLRAVLARYTGLDPSGLAFQVGASGKPALRDGSVLPQPLRFNLSHSHGRMLIAVARDRDVGVDLEQIRDKVEVVKLAERFYAAAEYQEILRFAGAGQAGEFYRYWVAKEAVLKGQGVGLRALQQCEILPGEDRSRAVSTVSQDSGLLPGWTVQWVDCGAGWAGAVSAHGSDWAVRVVNP